MNDLREALDQISLNELAQRARVATATITRLKLRGEFTRTSASGRIRHVLVADGLWPKDGEAVGDGNKPGFTDYGAGSPS